MIVIPAVDLKNGRCVRLRQGRVDAETVYSDDPVAIAQGWANQGASWLHVVDLDGAIEGQPRNLSVIEEIVRAVSVPVQVGGGMRTMDRIRRYLELGVARVIIGTLALERPTFTADICRRFPGRIAVSLDAREGTVALKGWQASTGLDYLAVARQIAGWHPVVMIFTAIQRDGTLEGPDLSRLEALLTAVSVPVIAAGGIGHIEHLQRLLPLASEGLYGVIIGKALYDGSVIFQEALAVTQRG
ncbi:MAG TPA: 1-(5-phosphoribosyl)-5-[(5-phosphoribosylamino)methylideneamino]imidazole-4-carboxamide isomerase [Candidatus Tectomicrobia bacterium]|nr:1-(5-phosphoribosyl)-5-[(5-phosphoribosylamino)methylideneamino]imidazole-4-carboxamide isomerase [Candidatus Tectomicrobia bacterium]